MPAQVQLGPWMPDIASVDSGAMHSAINVFPQKNGYTPVKSLQAVTTALPNTCKGAIAVRLQSGSYAFFAGTADGLYKFDSVTTGWTDLSNPGTAYSVPDDDYWSFAQFGQILLATHVNAPVQAINIDVGTAFADLAGSPPRAQAVHIVGGFVVLTGLVDFPRRIQWSGLEDHEFWTPGLNSSDYQDFPDGGNVTGVAGGEFGVVFQEQAIRQMTFAPGTAEVFQFTKLEDGRGAVGPWSILRIGPRTFFVDRDGLYLFTGGASAPIGAQSINNWFVGNIDNQYMSKTIAAVDVTGSRVLWAFKSQSASDPNLLDKQLVYDWNLNRWSELNVSSRYWITAATPAVSIDSIAGSIDDLDVSLDSALFAGGIPTLSVFTSANVMSFLEGPNLEATLETADAMVARPNRAFVRGIRLDSDAETFHARVGRRENLNAEVSWGVEQQPAVTMFAPARSSGRYHRARIRIPAGTEWAYASSIEVDAVAEGLR